MMRAPAVGLTVAVLLLPASGSAQSRLLSQPVNVPHPAPRAAAGPVVTVAPVAVVDADDDESLAAIQRASDRIAERLRPLEERLRSDDRLRRAGTVLGLGAVALGAVRGTAPLTFAGTQAIRFGLHRQLTAIEDHTGFSVTPSIGHRSVSVTVAKTFR